MDSIHCFSSEGIFSQHSNALIWSGQSADSIESVPGAVATGSLSRFWGPLHNDPVATAPGTDLILKLGPCPQHVLHNPNLSALAAIDIGREIEHFSILPRPRSVE